MTKRKVSNAKKNKSIQTNKTEQTAAESVVVESETQSLVEGKTINAKKIQKEESKTINVKTIKEETLETNSVAESTVEEPLQANCAAKSTAEEPLKTDSIEEIISEKSKTEVYTTPRTSIAFIGTECYPFVKTGGLGDVMYALPKALIKQNCDVKVILPCYKCISQKYQEKMVYKGSFQMDLYADGKSFYVGIKEYVWDGVVYDFIDNAYAVYRTWFRGSEIRRFFPVLRRCLQRKCMFQYHVDKNLSWDHSAKQYKDLYLELT